MRIPSPFRDLPRRYRGNKSKLASEKRLAGVYFLAFVGFILIAATPYAKAVDSLLAYVALPLFLALSTLTIYSWKQARDIAGHKAARTSWPIRMEAFLRKLPPF